VTARGQVYRVPVVPSADRYRGAGENWRWECLADVRWGGWADTHTEAIAALTNHLRDEHGSD
jgi:hypothetical protein